MSWHTRSLAPGDVHHGALTDGSVRAACGLTFYPLPAPDHAPRPPRPEQVCPTCRAPNGQLAMIPATCSTHPDTGIITLDVRRLDDGRITLESPAHQGCALTADPAVVFDVLGEWLG